MSVCFIRIEPVSYGQAPNLVWRASTALALRRYETPVPRDTYHQQKGYRAAQSMCVISYHHERGETGRSMRSSSLNGGFERAPYTLDDEANTKRFAADFRAASSMFVVPSTFTFA